MVRVIIQSTYITQHGTRGYQGSESDYDPNKSASDYIEEFKKYVQYCIPGSCLIDVYSVARTIHNPDGSFMRDENGHRKEERLFFKSIW
jgi:hypothetical protein